MPLILFDTVWQAKSSSSDARLLLKFSVKQETSGWQSIYCDIQLSTTGIDFKISSQRPHIEVLVGSVVTQILRKHLQGTGLVSIQKHKIWRDQILHFHSQKDDVEKLVILQHAKPPTFELLVADASYLRLNSAGVFTKRKTSEVDRSAYEDRPLDEFLQQKDSIQADQTSVVSADSGRRRSLKRRLKTLHASFGKLQDEESLQQEELNVRAEIATLREFGYLREDIGQALENSGQSLKKIKTKQKIHGQRRKDILADIAAAQKELEALSHDAPAEDLVHTPTVPAAKARAEQTTKDQVRQPWYRYLLEPNIEIHVGRSAKENDLLTKQAKGHDLWLHVVQGTGSHVIVPRKSIKDEKKKGEILRAAAILAVHHSPLRQGFQGDVYCCEKRFLRKTKSLPAGKWLVERAESLFVRYDDADLKALLERRL